ncbi:hypothetical protein [Leucobacter sp. wl10]|uniref:hypothetical protein n=1 Tax=Leucobacter sp. wl10 TaxID=2304677 RepID=UPI000E5BDAAA|nr:hypothetical protein [Leucobacter sp. wl10]RGE21450.1 hypothetical protein D1J51_06305 [Leucobacter sp. wl10]
MNYYADLAAALRDRKCDETQVREILEAVREATAQGTATPEEEFGPAKQYAANYQGTHSPRPGRIVQWAAFGAAILAFLALRVVIFPGLDWLPWGALMGAGSFVFFGLLGDGIARRLNRRLPEGFRAEG